MTATGPYEVMVITGPTAAGKSALAMELCRVLGGEIVSADSVQIYRRLEIGSAKPTPTQRAEIPHWCVDVADPTEPFDVAQWCTLADQAISNIRGRNRVPIICGGTGFYLRVLLHGLDDMPTISDHTRHAVRNDLQLHGLESLYTELQSVDPVIANRIAAPDTQRITRAIEVFRETGRPLSDFQMKSEAIPARYRALVIGLWPDRPVLYEQINQRVGKMLDAGWVSEVEQLVADGVPTDSGPLTALGYRDIVSHLEGQADEPLSDRVARSHRRYAKRQITWFSGITSREDQLIHMDPYDPNTPCRILSLWNDSPQEKPTLDS
jgi:tRNA dimethylallyltransferase